METGKNKPAGNLSALKSRLGLAKPTTGADKSEEAVTSPSDDTTPVEHASMPATAPTEKTDPFAFAPPPKAQSGPDLISTAADTGPTPTAAKPPLWQQKKKLIGWGIGLFVLLLFVWSLGRVYGDRLAFNASIDDAQQIAEEVAAIGEVNQAIATALTEARARNKSIVYDEKLIADLETILAEAPATDPQKLKRQQERLFRTNYRRMAEVVAPLLRFYDASLRLRVISDNFVRFAQRSSDEINEYVDKATSQTNRAYGLVLSDDRNSYFLGTLVEVIPACRDQDKTFEACPDQQKGFNVRASTSSNWSFRPGKPGKKGRLGDIVIPIDIRSETWRQVAVGHPGYVTFKNYVRRFTDLRGIADSLTTSQKQLLNKLKARAEQDKVFAPI